jgi:hypothetical protein
MAGFYDKLHLIVRILLGEIKVMLPKIMIFLFSSCSYKNSDFKPKDPKERIFYDFSQEGKHEALKRKYGNEWMNK